jgi:hypothetical protein
MPDRDRWGGWTKGPQLRATGHFRVEKVAGAWWLVDPDGRLFFSHGVDCVRPGAETGVTGREAYSPGGRWRAIPKPFLRQERLCGPWFLQGDGNLQDVRFRTRQPARKYGPQWETVFRELAHRAIRAWGLNTVANWSDPKVTARPHATLPVSAPAANASRARTVGGAR